jgi:hypothetical protein
MVKKQIDQSVTRVDVGDYRIETQDGDARVVKKQEIELFSVFKLRKSIGTI